MNVLKRPIFLVIIAVVTVLSYGCVSHAAKIAGSYWSDFDSQDGSDWNIASGYVVVDAEDARNSSLALDGIGPFKGNGPSFNDPEVDFFEEGDEGAELLDTRPVSSDEWIEISVESGGTLSRISEKYGIKVDEIAQANELTDQHKLREGQTLFIPRSSDYVGDTLAHVKGLKDEELAKRKKAEPVRMTEYEIKNGDTLWSVANAFDLDVNSLFGSNKLSDIDKLKVGTLIRVPNQDGIFVTVKSGQTVESFAREYGIFVEAIMSANEMTPEAVIAQGNEIFLPGAKVNVFVETAGSKGAVAKKVKEKVTTKRGFGWPVVGKISSPYGWRRDPVRGGRDFHTGLDIKAPKGRPVVAAAAGKVVHAGWMGGYGRTIVISHPGGTTTLYGHSSKLLVNVGTNVKRGQRIALVGSTGRSTGNHVHFEVRQSGSPMNPLKYIR